MRLQKVKILGKDSGDLTDLLVMKRSLYRGLVRLQSYVEPALAERVDQYCAATGLSESALIKSSLTKSLDGTNDATLVLRRMDRLGRAREQDHRDLEFLSEAFSVFVRLWLAHTPGMPEEAKRTARMNAESRYKQFVEHVVEQFSGGRRFFDDLPQELLADQAELVAIGGGATDSKVRK
jgi:hypothetical protein